MRHGGGGRQGGYVSCFTNSDVDMLPGFGDDEDDLVNAEAGEGGTLGIIHNGMERFAGAASLEEIGEVGRDDGDINTACAALDEALDGEVDKFVPFVSSAPKKRIVQAVGITN